MVQARNRYPSRPWRGYSARELSDARPRLVVLTRFVAPVVELYILRDYKLSSPPKDESVAFQVSFELRFVDAFSLSPLATGTDPGHRPLGSKAKE